jgi:hypothetical protein
MNREMEKIFGEVTLPILRYCHDICLEGLRKTMKNARIVDVSVESTHFLYWF